MIKLPLCCEIHRVQPLGSGRTPCRRQVLAALKYLKRAATCAKTRETQMHRFKGRRSDSSGRLQSGAGVVMLQRYERKPKTCR